MINDKTKIIIVLLILVAGLGWFFVNSKTETSLQSHTSPPVTNSQLSQSQKVVTGTVSNVIDSTVYFNTGGEYKRVLLSANAQIIKEMAVKNAPTQMLNVKIADIKVGNVIAIFFDTVSASGQEYTASRIDIISDK